MKGEVLWMMSVFATVVRASALMKHVEAVAKQTAIATPGQPMPQPIRWSRAQAAPRSWKTMTPSRNAAAKMERQNTVVQVSVATSRASSPPGSSRGPPPRRERRRASAQPPRRP